MDDDDFDDGIGAAFYGVLVTVVLVGLLLAVGLWLKLAGG